MGFWKTKQTQQQKTNKTKSQTNTQNKQTNKHTKQTNKSYWNWTNLEPRNNLITCFLRCFNIHLNLGFLLGLNILKGFKKFNLFTLKKKKREYFLGGKIPNLTRNLKTRKFGFKSGRVRHLLFLLGLKKQ